MPYLDWSKSRVTGEKSLRWAVGLSIAVLIVVAYGLLIETSVAVGDEETEKTEPATSAATIDPLAARGYAVTGGAAPGYVEDRACASCHRDLFDSYQDVAMSQSFYRPQSARLIEDFESEGYFHEPSRRHYRMMRRDDGLVMKRYQLDAEGLPINVVEQRVDWILGSGNHSRTYLFATPGGELYQMPLAWYSQTRSWGMAPGFDRPDHLGLLRRVRRECMFCHNAYPDVPAGSDIYSASHVYPEKLPQGLGCQRCHGPGAEHARAAMQEQVDFGQIYSTIVNPSDLEPRQRDDVCYQCHLQPSVAIAGQRRFGRDIYSFRPGELLSDYLVQIDVVEEGQDKSDRFEINHHPYRLEQSRCFVASAGEMSCLSCHDPHRKVQASERAAHYRAACLQCHEVDACRLDEMTADASLPKVDAADCVACHMPKRRPEDVVQVVMTDHFIRRSPGGPELLAPLEETDPIIDDVVLVDPETAPQGALADIYRAFAVSEFTSGGHKTAVARLERLLPEVRPQELEPYLALARGQLKQQRGEPAKRTLEEILERSPDYPMARELLGLVESGLGRRMTAVMQLREVLARGQERPEAHFNLAVLLLQFDQTRDALTHLQKALELRPNMTAAWFYQGVAQAQLGDGAGAADSFRRALALDPEHSRAYLALSQILIRQDRRAEALRYLRHGAEYADSPEAIVKALAELEKAPLEQASK